MLFLPHLLHVDSEGERTGAERTEATPIAAARARTPLRSRVLALRLVYRKLSKRMGTNKTMIATARARTLLRSRVLTFRLMYRKLPKRIGTHKF
jgi:hypothetical protein